jgi:hypothetical protein
VAPNFEREGWWPKRGGESPGQVIVAFTVAKPPAIDGLTAMVHCDVLKLLGTWRTVGKRPTPARIISIGRRTSGYGEPTSDRVRAYPASRSLLCHDYLLTREHESYHRRGSRREGHQRRGEMNLKIFSCIVPWPSSSVVLTARFEEPCSPFSM